MAIAFKLAYRTAPYMSSTAYFLSGLENVVGQPDAKNGNKMAGVDVAVDGWTLSWICVSRPVKTSRDMNLGDGWERVRE